MESKPREPAQVTALLLNKCRQQQSLQRTICQHVYAIKVYSFGDDSQKKRAQQKNFKKTHCETSKSKKGFWRVLRQKKKKKKKKKVSEPIRERKKACSDITQNSLGGDLLIELGLKSTKDSVLDPVWTCKVRRLLLLSATIQETLTYSRQRPLCLPAVNTDKHKTLPEWFPPN